MGALMHQTTKGKDQKNDLPHFGNRDLGDHFPVRDRI